MTVRELITKLQTLGDPELEVYIDAQDVSFCPPWTVEQVEVARHHSDPDGAYIVVLS